MTERTYIRQNREGRSTLQDALFVLNFLNENFSELDTGEGKMHTVICNADFTASLRVGENKMTVEASTFDGKFILTIEDK